MHTTQTTCERFGEVVSQTDVRELQVVALSEETGATCIGIFTKFCTIGKCGNICYIASLWPTIFHVLVPVVCTQFTITHQACVHIVVSITTEWISEGCAEAEVLYAEVETETTREFRSSRLTHEVTCCFSPVWGRSTFHKAILFALVILLVEFYVSYILLQYIARCVNRIDSLVECITCFRVNTLISRKIEVVDWTTLHPSETACVLIEVHAVAAFTIHREFYDAVLVVWTIQADVEAYVLCLYSVCSQIEFYTSVTHLTIVYRDRSITLWKRCAAEEEHVWSQTVEVVNFTFNNTRNVKFNTHVYVLRLFPSKVFVTLAVEYERSFVVDITNSVHVCVGIVGWNT